MEPNTGKQDATPLLIYDGDCSFCTYWVRYWQKLTGNAVQYKPYQEVADQYPSISIKEFQRAVQYVAPNGTISSAAKASFLTLSHAPGKEFWLTLYRQMPGFAWMSEKAYSVISTHRSFFFALSILFWGRELKPSRYDLVSWLFLRVLGLIFFVAFYSFGTQALGLIGSQGIIPVTELMEAAKQQLGDKCYWALPMLFWFNSSDLAIQVICYGGLFLSVLLIFNILPRISLLLLYLFYLSLVYAGQFFMSFQWDLYLLETGILAIVLISFQIVGIWLLRWLLFRFMLAGGLVKVLSGDPTWQNFSALSYYFETQPLPTPLAWYAHHLSPTLLKIGSGGTLFIELVMPFLIFFPRNIRFISAFFILVLQTLILITGNYNFFNILTILLCIVLFDDAAIQKILPTKVSNFIQKKRVISPNIITRWVVYLFAIVTIFISIAQFYLRFVNQDSESSIAKIENTLAPLRLVSVYGPFAVMTTKRMEIIIEGSDDATNWIEYPFKYKPGNVNRRPLWNIPLQPRLDWQMWFAALGSIDNNPWVLRVMQKILENSPPVLELFDKNPFSDKPPVYMRAEFYQYEFTNDEEKSATGAWWKRTLVGLYVPEVRLK